MLASLQPNSPTSEQAVKILIDQRARASHTRYSSASYSQRSDSPSIYSRVDLSPNTQIHAQDEWISQSGDQISLMGQNQSAFDDDEDDSFTIFTRNSLGRDDQVSLPPADDDISIFSIPTPKAPVQPTSVPSPLQDQDIDAGSSGTEHVEEGSRMSMLGPKMRFVSKAPWELGEDDLAEEEEEPGSATDALSIFGSKMSSWRNKDQDKSSPKGLGLATRRSRSPGFSSASSRKGSGGTSSSMFRHETQREGPYGPHLASPSHSHGAIPSALASSTKSLHIVTDSLSSDHAAHRYTHGLAEVDVPTEPFSLPPHEYDNQNMTFSSGDEYATSSRSESPPPLGRYIHPYANPDLLSTTLSEHSTASLPQTRGTSFDGPSVGETQSLPLRRVSESATSSPPRGMSMRKGSVGGLALSAMPPKTMFGEHSDHDDMAHLVARPKARTFSKSIPTSPVRSMVSYGDHSGSPMHNLITLEQARARAQNTSKLGPGDNNAVAPAPRSTPSSTLVAGLGLAPGVVVDSSVVRGQRPNLQSLPPSDSSSGPTVVLDQRSGLQQRPRAMSIGKHIGNAAWGSGDGDVIPAKTLKHKKSAFMKLFQGKDKERERDYKEFVSPAPAYPVRAMSTPPQLPPQNDSSVPPLPNIHSIKRVPPPLPLSVVVTSPSFPPSDSPPVPSQEDGTSMRPSSPPRLRQASAPVSTSNPLPTQPFTQDRDNQLSSSEPEFSRPTASAPPTQMCFEALSLRPVSTIFSAKFPDLLSPSSPPADAGSAATPKRLDDPPPLTPGFSSSRSNSMSTSSDYPVTPTSLATTGPPSLGPMPGEDQSSVIASLHEQIANSRKAWQRQIWELEGQVRDLKAEVEELRNTGECETCGMAKCERRLRTPMPQNVSVVDRPRPRLGSGNTRSVFGGGCDM